MKTEWDYTDLANAYLQRPDYSKSAVEAMLSICKQEKGSKVCDMGAGVAHLTLLLAENSLSVDAVEPNNAMRHNGMKRTESLSNVKWHEGTGEESHQPENYFDLVTFGSSFNVCNRQLALKETARILKPKGWFSCMWNHRVLDDNIQKEIEKIIKSHIVTYGYGTRREDQTQIINESGLFGPVIQVKAPVVHQQTIAQCVEAWQSHATLQRQSKDRFNKIIKDIENYLKSLKSDIVQIPYITNIWISQLLEEST